MKNVRRAAPKLMGSGVALALLGVVMVWLLAGKQYTYILRSVGHLWEVSDAIAPADAVVVLGGNPARAYAAAQLYRSALAKRILLDIDGYRKLLLNLTIPSEAIETFGSGLKNTYEEACAIADWAKMNGARTFIVPTEPFFSRRVKWIFARKLGPIKARAIIDVLPITGFTADDWWLTSWGRDEFIREITGYLYYRVRYSFDRCPR
jgi:uncharacterized SAM-binding protein YcdF (DUF218 family)